VDETREPARELGVGAALRRALQQIGGGRHRHHGIGLRQRHRESAPPHDRIDEPAHAMDQPLGGHGQERV
jgi:hypothetical protein